MYYTVYETCNQRTKAGERKERRGAKKKKKIEDPSTGLIWQMHCRKKGCSSSGGWGAHQNEIFCYYISHYADLCQIRGSDWIKIGPKPQNLSKLFMDFLSFPFFSFSSSHETKKKKKGEKFHFLFAGSDSIPTSECSLRCVWIKAVNPWAA